MMEQFEIVFFTGLFMLMFSIVTIILLKVNVILKNKDIEQNRLRMFFKKMILFSSVIIIAVIAIYVLFPETFKNKIYDNRNEYIDDILRVGKEENIPDSISVLFANKSYEYLYNKYGEEILYEEFRGTLEDSIEIRLIMHFIENPNLKDSVKQNLRNKIKTKNDYKKYLKRRLIKDKDEYISKTIIQTRKQNISDSIGFEYANKSYKYFYYKYGEKIFYEDLKKNFDDIVETGLIYYCIKHPNTSDSIRQILRNNIKNIEDLNRLLRK